MLFLFFQIVVVFIIVFAGILILYLIALLALDPSMLMRGHSDPRRTMPDSIVSLLLFCTVLLQASILTAAIDVVPPPSWP